MAGKTFVEKIFNAQAGSIVFKHPDIVLSHDNTASIEKTFRKMGGEHVADPSQLMIVLDHNAPPTSSKLANDYQRIRDFVREEDIRRFHDVGDGICHQLMSHYAIPGMVIVGSDSHTCTAGAFNAFAAGIDRTETAGIWKKGETWFKVPDTLKIKLKGELNKNVFAKDLALHIIGIIGSAGADYMSIEFHGKGVRTLTVADRMTIANLASEMGAKNAVFPYDEVLESYYNSFKNGIWADKDATYAREIEIHLSDVHPLVAAPHHVDHVRSVEELNEVPIHQALIGTCTNGRIEDLREAAKVLAGNKIAEGVQLLVTPASKQTYLQAIKEDIMGTLIEAGATILAPSCGSCLGTGQGIPADGMNVISTANRNFLGRMGNKAANIYLASPSTVAKSAIEGKITPVVKNGSYSYPFKQKQSDSVTIDEKDDRLINGVWDYTDVDNLNTDQMFAGNLTYEISSAEPTKIVPHLFASFDSSFALKIAKGQVIIAGDNFGCGSSREHPSVGLRYAGIKAIIVKSVSRIFYRSAINQGLPIIVSPKAVEIYKKGDAITIDLQNGSLIIGKQIIKIDVLPEKLQQIIASGGLVKWIKKN
jgi:3-isopropylmalate/(R)-2-methylmalate dehydratase large subunit